MASPPSVPTVSFGSPKRFVPQKGRALHRAKGIVLCLLGLGLMAIAGLIWRYLF
jgi:hypothetical protein